MTVHAMCTLGTRNCHIKRAAQSRRARCSIRRTIATTRHYKLWPIGESCSRLGLKPTVAVTCGSTLGRTLGTEVNAKSCATASRVKMQYRLHLALCTSYVQQVPRIPPKDEHGTFPNSVLLPAAFLLHYAKAVRAHTLGAMNVHHAKY